MELVALNLCKRLGKLSRLVGRDSVMFSTSLEIQQVLQLGEREKTEFLRDAVINFISAGLDTTSSAFCWFFWLLSLNQEVERNILKELETIREQKGKNIGDGCSLADVRVINFRGTAILQDGTFVGEGWIVMYQTFAMENTWGKNCYEFVPERWLDNGK